MSNEVTAAIVAALAVVVSAGVAAGVTWWSARHTRALSVEDALQKYRQPLMRAAYDLQSRIYNIVRQHFLGVYGSSAVAEERDYALRNTQFVVAQFFAWNEIVRRDVQFADLERDRSGRLSEQLDTITHLWSTDGLGSEFRVFAGEQRAIGERMIQSRGERLDCLGYADFCDVAATARIPHLVKLERDIGKVTRGQRDIFDRLILIQNSLIDLLDILDPDARRLPRSRRSKLPPAKSVT